MKMIRTLILSFAFITATLATPALADKPSLTLYQGFSPNGYIYQDFGFMASNHAVAEGGATFSWKSGDSFDLWYSSGAGGSANEIDVSWWHNGSFDSPLGPMTYQVKAAYYFLSIGKDRITDLRDDVVYTHLDLGRTFDLGRFTLGIHSKTELVSGTKELPFQSVERIGVPIDFTIARSVFGSSDALTAEVEPGKVWNLTGNGHSPWILTPALFYKLAPNVTLTAKDKVAYVGHRTIHEILFEVSWTVN